MATIFHLALASDWAAAQEAGAYTISTRGRTLAEEGFIHASRGDQWPKVRDLFYADVTEPMLLLQIDTDRLDVPVVEEAPEPGTRETFPHIYGPLPLEAVVKAIPLQAATAPPHTTAPRPPAPAPAPAPEARPAPAPQQTDSFGRIFLAEVFFNMVLVILILVAASIGLAVGGTLGDEVAPLVGLVVGVLAGAALARWLYTRRHAAR